MHESIIKSIREKREQIWHEAKTLADRASDENRAFEGEEEQTWQRLNADLDAHDEMLSNAKTLVDREARAEHTENVFKELLAGRGDPSMVGRRSFDDARGGVNAQFRKHAQQNSMAPIELRLGQERGAFQPGLEKRALATTSGSGMLGVTFGDRLISNLVESSAILSAGATVLSTATGETYRVPKSTAYSTATIVTEGNTISSSDPTLGSVALGAYKYGFLVKVSHEMVNDVSFDIEGFLAQQCGLALGNAFGAHAITGTGTSQPSGIVTGATLGVTGSTGVTGAPSADNLIDLQHSLIEPYLRSAGAAWLMRSTTLGTVRKLKDTTNRYLFDLDPNTSSGSAGLLLGKPIYLDPNVAAVGLGAKSVLFGDVSRYWVRLVEGVRFERSLDFSFDTDQITYRCLFRADGALIDTSGAVKWFAGGAS